MASGPIRPPTPSPSATLILARGCEAGIEVYLLRRSTISNFMPGVYVFPGGKLESEDKETSFWQDHVDLPVDQLALVLGGEVNRMLPYAVAAIRETWEEAGLLMANTEIPHSDSEQHVSGGLAFKRWIQANGILLSVSRLGHWHHWITPELMPRRFDTFFFTVPVEPGQDCRPDNHETVHGIWIHPKKALFENENGSLPLSPPTLVTLHQMLPFDDIDALMDDTQCRSWPTPIMPRLWPLENSALIIEPWDPDYACKTVRVDVDRLERDLLPVGEPFSRLWHHRGIYRPVRYPEDS